MDMALLNTLSRLKIFASWVLSYVYHQWLEGAYTYISWREVERLRWSLARRKFPTVAEIRYHRTAPPTELINTENKFLLSEVSAFDVIALCRRPSSDRPRCCDVFHKQESSSWHFTLDTSRHSGDRISVTCHIF